MRTESRGLSVDQVRIGSLVHLQPPHELLSFLCRLQRPAHALSFALLWQHAHNPPNRVIHTEHEHPDGAFRPRVLFLRALADAVETQWRVALEKMICHRSLPEKSMQFSATHGKAASRAEICTITFSPIEKYSCQPQASALDVWCTDFFKQITEGLRAE